MLGKLIPIVIALMGIGAGVGAGIALRPAPETEMAVANPCGEMAPAPANATAAAVPSAEAAANSEFAKMSNDFVFPLIESGRVAALVVLSITLEMAMGQTEAVFQREPKLRDGFLRVLLDHANAGGFQGTFTSNTSMDSLRRALLEKGREDLGDALFDVLILDINRQDT